MIVPRRAPLHGVRQYVTATMPVATLRPAQFGPGRAAAIRSLIRSETNSQPSLVSSSYITPFSPKLTTSNHTLLRSLHTSPQRYQQTQAKDEPKQDVKDPPRDEQPKQEAGEGGEQKTDETKDEKSGKEEKDSKPPPPPHGDKTPWQVFTETLRNEFKASKEWNESTKQLSGSVQQFTESEAVRRAREASEAASKGTSQVLKSTGRAIGKGAAWTWDTKVVQGLRQGVNATGRTIEKATRPVRETKAFKEIQEAVDDGSSTRYGGWIEKEERRKRREALRMKEEKEGKRAPAEPLVEDPNAGTNITVHKDAAWKESWNKFKENSKLMQGLFNMKTTYEESENPLISTARSISDRVAGFFAENETAMVIKKFREMDPSFQLEPFLRDLREYILPEVLDAYVKGDVETLKLWLSAAQFQVYSALMEQYTKAGLKSDGRILDIRHVDILNARLLEPGDIPVFIITCRTQEVHVYRHKETGQLAAGMEDKVQLVTYAIGMTRLPEEVNNPETRGWRMIELQKAARDYI
ncbi:protein translocase subunit [Exophiala dermatitidis]|uniref:Mitochondrial import inner membrane translocase subunit TIM44 n=2 Tax=Exophiala dermatitidis TaxID=5970 RepID=H6BTY8_EXODN|nr:mitochondrial protein-transporting ATPase [Exophiala dermatitidis NIH/UT8656]KAJ4508972.1 protein translocase subunit [Exophiala dermatitidis]EHY55565.1 mitochondrial protein-transporting ATPase [Exophiala dermatitidis NIH/UT8656]KAJ4510224.1 protein translocase subunit [Exophiala dermatitidis]KAJ4539234.1 protein translocase subunit [Exophiala dermatitidis]KAJ4540485.1 protein translocase subunit [Exophiala dermatitidis]